MQDHRQIKLLQSLIWVLVLHRLAKHSERRFVALTLVVHELTLQNGNPEQAIEWLFSNPGDPGEEETAPVIATSKADDVGGSASLPANYRLKAFISHKGPSVHSGHYVATIRQPQHGLPDESEGKDEWVLFNDEKVVRAPPAGGEEMRSLAYLYIYERV